MEEKDKKPTAGRDNSQSTHKKWAGEKKPSMKRRSEENNYTERGLYMVTLVIEGRQPLLGELRGNADIRQGDIGNVYIGQGGEAPHVVLSPFGERVKQCWLAIQEHNPEIETMKLCIMPDHIHGILFVHEKIDRHLGHVINGFKAGTRKAARELGIIAEAMPQPTEHTQKQHPAPVPPAAPVPNAEALPQPRPQPNRTKHPAHGTIWEPNYNDRILLKKNQLQHWLAYLDDNPRRLLLKRQHPEYFSPLGRFLVADTPMRAMGNIALLTHRSMMALQCSRHLYQQEIDSLQRDFLALGQAGTFVISACISPGEQQIATACIEAGIPFIILLVHGFPPFYKPQPLYLKACAEGRLLLLSPFEWQNEKITNMRQRCLYLNDLAFRISEAACRGTLQVIPLR